MINRVHSLSSKSHKLVNKSLLRLVSACHRPVQTSEPRFLAGQRLTRLNQALVLLLRPGTGAGYCDQFVCLSVRQHNISGTVRLFFTKCFVQIPLVCLGPPLAALRYVMYFQFYG